MFSFCLFFCFCFSLRNDFPVVRKVSIKVTAWGNEGGWGGRSGVNGFDLQS